MGYASRIPVGSIAMLTILPIVIVFIGGRRNLGAYAGTASKSDESLAV